MKFPDYPSTPRRFEVRPGIPSTKTRATARAAFLFRRYATLASVG